MIDDMKSQLSDTELDQASGGYAQVIITAVVMGLTLFGAIEADNPSTGKGAGSPSVRRGTT